MNKYLSIIIIMLLLCFLCSCIANRNMKNANTYTIESINNTTKVEKATIMSTVTPSNSITQTYDTTERKKTTRIPTLTKTPTQEELSKEKENFYEKVDKIFSADRIDKIKFSIGGPTGFGYVLESSDYSIISKWKQLLKELEVSAMRWDPAGGVGYSVIFYIGSEEFSTGGIMDEYIYIANNSDIMLKIDNYYELRNKFMEVERLMGYDCEN